MMRQKTVGNRRYVLLATVLAVAVPALWFTYIRVAAPFSAAADREALVALYRATDGASWRNNANWLSDAPLAAWRGVPTGVVA